MFKKIREIWEITIARYIFIGFVNTFNDLLVFNVLFSVFGLNKIVANTISVTFAMTLSYFFHHYIVYRYKQKPNFYKYIEFMGITTLGTIILQALIIKLFTDIAPFPGDIAESIGKFIGLNFSTEFFHNNAAKIIAVAFSMVSNYIFYQKIVFVVKHRGENKHPAPKKSSKK